MWHVGYSPDGNPQSYYCLPGRCLLCSRCGPLLSLPVNWCRCARTRNSGFLGLFCYGPYNIIIVTATAWACDIVSNIKFWTYTFSMYITTLRHGNVGHWRTLPCVLPVVLRDVNSAKYAFSFYFETNKNLVHRRREGGPRGPMPYAWLAATPLQCGAASLVWRGAYALSTRQGSTIFFKSLTKLCSIMFFF